MKVPGGPKDNGYDKYVPKTVTAQEAEAQSRLTKEQLDEIEKWRLMSADERKKVMDRLVREIDGDGKCESSSKGTTDAAQSANSGPPKRSLSNDAATPGSTRWIISEIVKLLVSLPTGELSTDDECALITVHVLLRTIQVREGFSQSGGSVTTTVSANVPKDAVGGPTDGESNKKDGSSNSKK